MPPERLIVGVSANIFVPNGTFRFIFTPEILPGTLGINSSNKKELIVFCVGSICIPPPL